MGKEAVGTYTHEVRVRYAETDQMGVLHHSRMFVLLELARTEMLRRHGLTYRQMEEGGWFLVPVLAILVALAFRRESAKSDIPQEVAP